MDFARRLERERDEAREQLEITQNNARKLISSLAEEQEESGTYYARFSIASDERDTAIRERDEAREAFAISMDQLVQTQIERRKLHETIARLKKVVTTDHESKEAFIARVKSILTDDQ